jgi:hypothetical protein
MADRMDTCASCRFWRRFPDMVGGGEGECRRRAPVALDENRAVGHTAPAWPHTDSSDWCGDYEPRRGG